MSKRWLLVAFLVAGCSGSDTPPLTGTVTVAVVRDGRPIPAAAVVFHDPDGAVVGRGTTDAAGVVIGEVPTGGMVTVLDPDLAKNLVTLTAVTPGPARLEVPLDTSLQLPPGPEAGTLTIPAAGALPAGTDHVAIETGCGMFDAPTLPATVPITADCITMARAVPVIVTAWEPPGDLEHPGDSLAAFAGLAVAPSGSSGFALATAAWSTDCAQLDVETDPLMSVQLQTRLGGLEFRSTPGGYCQVTQPATGYAYSTYDFGEGITVNGFAYPAGQSNRGEMFRTRFDDLPATLAISEATDLLVGDVDMTGFDGNGASWTTDSALADADVIMAALAWSTPDQSYVTWRFILPPDATAAIRPELPDDLVTWPALDTAVDHVAEVRWHDAPWLPDFDGIEHTLPAVLDPAPRVLYQPVGTSLRWYRELFYPDAQ